MISRRRFITISAGLALAGAAGAAHAETATWRGVALGAGAKITIAGMNAAQAEEILQAARAEIERLEGEFSLYRSDSALMRLNRTGTLEDPTPDMLSLLSMAGNIHSLTGGMFDPTVQPLWTTYAEARGYPAAADIAQARTRVGWPLIEVAAETVRIGRAGGELTLNGIAQGYITDRVVALMRSHGLRDAIASLGEIAALGQRAPGQPWRVGIAPSADGPAEEYVDLADRAIATSSALGTTFDSGEPTGDSGEPARRVGHIINPKTGIAGPGNWARISVLHRSAAVADGLSTGFALMEAQEIEDTVRRIAGAEAIALSRDGRRFHFTGA